MRSSYLGVTKWQTRSAHSSAETERQNLGGLLDSCFGNLGLFESAAETVRSCSALAGTPADLATDEAAPHRFFDLLDRSELRDKRGTVRSATKHTAAGYSIEHEAHGGRKTPPSASTTPLSARLMPQLGSERS